MTCDTMVVVMSEQIKTDLNNLSLSIRIEETTYYFGMYSTMFLSSSHFFFYFLSLFFLLKIDFF